MKKMKYLRTWLVVALVITIIGSLTGGTVAWFTDSVETANNTIQSGTLKIDIELKDGDNWISLKDNPTTEVFNYDLWEPGYTQLETLKIVNEGNLALEYILNVNPGVDEVKSENGVSLASAIEVYMCFGEPTSTDGVETRKAFHTAKAAGVDQTVAGNIWWYAGKLSDLIVDEDGFTQGKMLPAGKIEGKDDTLIQTEDGTILMQKSCTCTVALHMDEDAGNEYQNLSLGTVGLSLKAKQYMYEEDAFDEKYDEDATYVTLPAAGSNIMSEEERSGLTLSTWNGFGPESVPQTLLNEDGTMTLDYGLTFQATEDVADLAGKPYEKWNADFEVSISKPITAADCTNGAPFVLVGEYGNFGWVPIALEMTGEDVIEANKEYRLLKTFIEASGSNGAFTYKDVLNFVGTFNCGIKADPAWATAGTPLTVTVQLKVYETNTNGEEIASYTIAAGSYTY